MRCGTKRDAMELRERPHGATVIVDVHPPVDRESGATTRLAIALKRIVDSGVRTILLNVAELTDVDSVLLGAITQSHTTAIRSGVSLKLLNVSPRLRELLVMTRLDRFIEVASPEEADIAARN
jgi:anti-sigma B factor antagonist